MIVPDTIVIDHGRLFISATFRAACRHLGISMQPAHLGSGADKPRAAYCTSSGRFVWS